MTKRPIEAASSSPAPERRTSRKNEQSHLEHQERAYVAASRRSDRDLKARFHSALMASEIHKQRTGRGLKITEEIVQREEMYEEEEDEYPRHHRAVAAQLPTTGTGPDMNSRVNAYLTSQIVVTSMAREQELSAREQEVQRLFAAAFPAMVAQGTQPGQFQRVYCYHAQDFAQQFQNFQFSGHPIDRDRTHSLPDTFQPHSPYPHAPGAYHHAPTHQPPTRHVSLDAHMSPTNSTTPGSMAPMTTTTPFTDFSGEEAQEKEFPPAPMDPSLTMSTLPDDHTTSSLMSGLPPETRMLLSANIRIDEQMQMVSAMNADELLGSEDYYPDPHASPYHNFPQHMDPVSQQEVLANNFNIQEFRIESLAQAENDNVDFEEWITDPNLPQ